MIRHCYETWKERERMKTRETSVLGLTWPIFIELFLQLLVGNVDQIMVGRTDPNGVGAISNANQITALLLLVFSVVCTAAMILVAQYLGAGDTRRVGRTCAAALTANFAFGAAVSLILLLFCGPIFRAMGVAPEIFGRACLYTRIIGLGMPLQAVFLTYTAFFRSSQLMKETMLVSVLVNCLNIAGNALLIGGPFGLPALGVAGAAISSDLSRLAGVVVMGLLYRRRFGRVLTAENLRPFPREQLLRLLRLGLPTGGESVSYNLSQICIQTVTNRFPLFVVNTRAYANLFANVTYLFSSAVGQATQVVAARLMGAGRVRETHRRVMTTMLWSLLASGSVSVLLWLLARPLYGLFTSDPGILALCPVIMLIEIPLELGRAVNIVLVRCLQAAGDIAYPTVLCVIFAWLFGVGGAWLFGVYLDLGLAGIWLSMALDECVRAALLFLRWMSGRWKSKHII